MHFPSPNSAHFPKSSNRILMPRSNHLANILVAAVVSCAFACADDTSPTPSGADAAPTGPLSSLETKTVGGVTTFAQPIQFRSLVTETLEECEQIQAESTVFNCYQTLNLCPSGYAMIILTDIANAGTYAIEAETLETSWESGDAGSALSFIVGENSLRRPGSDRDWLVYDSEFVGRDCEGR